VPTPASSNPARAHASDTTTRHLRIQVRPQYVPEGDLDPDAPHLAPGEQWQARRYIFAYTVRITNQGGETVQLISRHWTIVDADGERHEVRGEGVVGKQPTLAPGHSFEYSSYCPLATPWGTMEGEYLMETEHGERFEAVVGRFYLVSEASQSPA
jgi:ApaG protein